LRDGYDGALKWIKALGGAKSQPEETVSWWIRKNQACDLSTLLSASFLFPAEAKPLELYIRMSLSILYLPTSSVGNGLGALAASRETAKKIGPDWTTIFTSSHPGTF